MTAAGQPGPTDVLDHVSGAGSALGTAALRAARPDLTRFSQASYQSLLEPDGDDGLDRRERELVALRVALLTLDRELAAWHEARLVALTGNVATGTAVSGFPAASPDLTPRDIALLRHTDLVTQRPTEAEPADIEALRTAGLSTREIVTLAQLIAFVAFQVRILATLRAFAAMDGATP